MCVTSLLKTFIELYDKGLSGEDLNNIEVEVEVEVNVAFILFNAGCLYFAEAAIASNALFKSGRRGTSSRTKEVLR